MVSEWLIRSLYKSLEARVRRLEQMANVTEVRVHRPSMDAVYRDAERYRFLRTHGIKFWTETREMAGCNEFLDREVDELMERVGKS